MADAATIHALAERLFDPGYSSEWTDDTARQSAVLDPSTNVVYTTVTVPLSYLAADLRAKVDDSVERNTIAFLADLGIVAKMVEDPKFGRAFHMSLPGEFIGISWDEILRKYDKPSRDSELLDQ